MAATAGQPAGNIYDLGYRHYDGPRLGRSHAAFTLFTDSFRAVFGLGRRATSKIFPMGFAVVLLLPAIVELGVAAVGSGKIRIIEPENYFNITQVIVFLFCAAVAPELTGRDQRSGMLSLYFSRAILRRDYAAAKFAALFTGLLVVIVLPQVLLFLGSMVASNDSTGYLRDNWQDIPVVMVCAVVIAGFMAALSLAIASQTPRRSYATVAVLAFFILITIIGGILYQTLSGDWKRYIVLMNPVSDIDGFTFWMFGTAPRTDSAVEYAHFGGLEYLAVILLATAIGCLFFFRRYERIPA